LTTIELSQRSFFDNYSLKNNGRGMERDKDIPVKIFSRGMEDSFDVELFHLFSVV
jgi:hypothetical protein